MEVDEEKEVKYVVKFKIRLDMLHVSIIRIYFITNYRKKLRKLMKTP